MRIAVIGASGMVGSRVVTELAGRGHEVTAVTRTGTQVPEAATSVAGNLGDADFISKLAADHEVIFSATGPSRTGEDHQIWLDALKTAETNAGDSRLFVIGGAGSLLIDGTRLVDLPGFPESYRAEALTAAQALETIREAPESLDLGLPVSRTGDRPRRADRQLPNRGRLACRRHDLRRGLRRGHRRRDRAAEAPPRAVHRRELNRLARLAN